MQKGILHLSHSPTIGLTGFLQALPPSIIAVHLGLAILLFSKMRRGKSAGGGHECSWRDEYSEVVKGRGRSYGRQECEDGASLVLGFGRRVSSREGG